MTAPGDPAGQAAADKPVLLELTTLRFAAAVAVLLGHFNHYIGFPILLGRAISGGWGVSFFFVLSGFILCYRYWDDFAGGVRGGAYRNYFVARVARVYPSYVMALVLITMLYVAMDLSRPGFAGFPPNPVTSWLANLLALQTFAPSYETQQFWNAPGWSISTEFAFYALCPFILAAIARGCRTGRSLAIVFLASLAFGIVAHGVVLYLVRIRGWDEGHWQYLVSARNIVWRLPQFITGIVFARLLMGGHLPWLAKAGARNALLLAGLVGVLVMNVAPVPTETRFDAALRQLRMDFLYMIPFGLVVVAAAAGRTFASPVLRHPAGVFLGEISYAVYIYHWIAWMMLAFAARLGTPVTPLAAWGTMAAVLAASALSYLAFERPARAWIRRRFSGP